MCTDTGPIQVGLPPLLFMDGESAYEVLIVMNYCHLPHSMMWEGSTFQYIFMGKPIRPYWIIPTHAHEERQAPAKH